MKKTILAMSLLALSSLTFAETGTEKLMNKIANGSYTVKFEGQDCSLLLSYSSAGYESSGLPIMLEAVMEKDEQYSISSQTKFDNAISSAKKISVVERAGIIVLKSKIVVNVDSEGKPTSAEASERLAYQFRKFSCKFN